MEGWKQTGAHHSEDRHGLSGAIDGRAPFLTSEEKNGGDESASVTDTDPEHEVCDVPSPSNGLLLTPDTDSGADKVSEAENHDTRQNDGRHHEHPPEQWLLIFNDSADAVCDPGVGTIVEDEWLAVQDAGSTCVSF